MLSVTTMGDSIASAKAWAYEVVAKISFDKAYYRRNIADKAIQ